MGRPIKSINALFFSNELFRKAVVWIYDLRFHCNYDKALKYEENDDFDAVFLYYKKSLKIAKKNHEELYPINLIYVRLRIFFSDRGNDTLSQKYENLQKNIHIDYPHSYELKREDLWKNL